MHIFIKYYKYEKMIAGLFILVQKLQIIFNTRYYIYVYSYLML